MLENNAALPQDFLSCRKKERMAVHRIIVKVLYIENMDRIDEGVVKEKRTEC